MKKKPSADIDELVGYCEEGTTITIPERFLDHVFLLYGESGAGKTSTLSKIPGAYIIQCDPNRKGLAVRQTNIPDIPLKKQIANPLEYTPWDVVEATLEKILQDDSVDCVIFDNMSNLYNFAMNHYCAKKRVQSLQEINDYGASWTAVDRMYCDWFSAIVDSDRGLGFICHQKEREIQLAGGGSTIQIVPDVPNRMFQAIRYYTNFVFYLGFDHNGNRVVTVRNDSDDIYHKCCTDEDTPRFFDPEGKPVHRIPAGGSPGECWANIQKSWNNELHDVDYEPPKPKKKNFKKKVLDT